MYRAKVGKGGIRDVDFVLHWLKIYLSLITMLYLTGTTLTGVIDTSMAPILAAFIGLTIS